MVKTRQRLPPATLEEIMALLRARLPELRQRYQLRSLGVFGSWVRGEQRRGSDLDVLVEFEAATWSLLDFLALQEHLSRLLEARVDLVEKRGLKPYIGRRILDEVIYVSEDELPPSSLPDRKGDGALRQEREIRDYLHDILENAGNVEEFCRGIDLDGLFSDRQRAYAVLHAMQIIGEAARHIPGPIRQSHPEVPWRRIVVLRNVVVHEYFAVILPNVWSIIQGHLPALRQAVETILAEVKGRDAGG